MPQKSAVQNSFLAGRGFLFYDRQDRLLVEMVNSVVNLPASDASLTLLSNLFDSALHPNGIKRLAVSREERIAYAVVNLLESLEEGSREKRLEALGTLYDEVLYSAGTEFRINTGRLLIQIMKELVRARGNLLLQEKLAHDFRMVSFGNPRIVRKLLTSYNLLEMPEDGSQLTFDNHVHDSHTKGRKSPTHLIMDAWVKGIRSLTVVYYNHVEAGPARELLEAARIVGISVRIGIEFSCSFYGRRAKFIWAPQNFASTEEFVGFLQKPHIEHLMREGREVSLFREGIIFELLDNFNRAHIASVNREYDIQLPHLDRDEFDRFVARGQASRLHLAEFVFRKMLPLLERRSLELVEKKRKADPEEAGKIDRLLRKMNELTPEDILYSFLSPEANPGVPDPDNPPLDMPQPVLLRRDIASMVRWVSDLHANSDIVLTLTNLSVEDAVEILYDCEGLISHIELFNYKDYMTGRSPQIRRINTLQNAINEGKVLVIKRILRRIVRKMKAAEGQDSFRLDKFEKILRDIPHFQSFYARRPLGSRLGSDSTGRSKRFFGMGLAFLKTLPARARRAIARRQGLHLVLPVHSLVYPRVDYLPRSDYGILGKRLSLLLARVPGLSFLGSSKKKRWVVRSNFTRFTNKGNVITLGSTGGDNSLLRAQFPPAPTAPPPSGRELGTFYLNTAMKNVLKVLAGLTVATCTFMYTQNWWLLAFFGGAIWLSITLLRNILQSVLGGGGFRRSSTLHWSDYMNWERVADSLFYTGFSVPLLELFMRVLFLQDLLGVNADSHPLFVYTVISLVNGLYITGHNIYRGLPREAAVGNLFRSALAIPTALAFSSIFGEALALVGVAEDAADLMVIHGATIISKFSSDTVAAVIEGLADRARNRRNRVFDYSLKLKQMFAVFTRLEMSFPDREGIEVLKDPQTVLNWGMDAERAAAEGSCGSFPAGRRGGGNEALEFERTLVINALDLMYFWHYQPRARDVLRSILYRLTLEERTIFLYCQNVLSSEQRISMMIVDGLLGRNFSKALSFYLDRWQPYLASMQKLTGIK